MIIDTRIKWVERFKRSLNHYHNGIKDGKVNDKMRVPIIYDKKPKEIIVKRNVSVRSLSKKHSIDFDILIRLAGIIGIKWFWLNDSAHGRNRFVEEKDVPHLIEYIEYYKSL